MMYLSSLFSTLFRLAAFVYLRVIPTTLGKLVLPVLYLAHLATIPFLLRDEPKQTEKKVEGSPEPVAKTPSRTDSWLAILLSLPTPSKGIRSLNVAVNALLFLAIVDFTITPFLDTASDVVFTRVGAVYPDAVKIVVRNADIDVNSTQILWREATPGLETPNPWKDGPIAHLQSERDWVDTVKLTGLWPSTSYEYTLASLNRTILPYPASPIPFRTFPDPRYQTGTHFRFVTSSCITPNFPYVPLQSRTIKGFDLLAEYVFPKTKEPELQDTESTEIAPSTLPTEFLLFLGDFIYADVPVYAGDNLEAYRKLYRRNYGSDSFRKLYERLPIFHVYDDHEITNNFAGNGNDSKPPYPNASDAWKIYNADANYDSVNQDQYYYDFRYGDVAFFMMDTRRYRSCEEGGVCSMLGDTQLAALHDWISKVNSTATFKFIVTSVPFTSLWTHDAQTDSWAGFAAEKAALLETLHSVPNVIFLSGDRHEFAAVEFNGEGTHTVREFSTSPLSMFYIPFVRTLNMESVETVQKLRVEVNLTETGPEYVATTVDKPRERVMEYQAKGNYKWSAFEIDTRDREAPTLKLELMVDGKPRYHYSLVGTPVKLQSSTAALGAFVSTGIKDIFDKMGMKPSKWF